jgi:hypothetical protein
MVDNDEDRGRSTGWVLGGWTIERSGATVDGLYRAQGDKEHVFLSLASKPRLTVLPVWPQNYWLRFLWFGLKTTRSGFLVWASKPAAAVWCFSPQNHSDGFLVWPSKPCGLWFVDCATKSMGG